MKPWKKLNSEALIDDRWLKVTADTCELPNGKSVAPFYVVHEEDFVHVCALTPERQLVLVRQYRYAADAVVTEFPGGVIDKGETPLQAARRELREETGYSSEDWTYVGKMFVNPARMTNTLHVVLAKNCVWTDALDLDHSEDLESERVPLDALPELIASGAFSQSMHIASYYLCLEKLGS